MQSSWPHVYPGMPAGDYSPEWQGCASCSVYHVPTLPIHLDDVLADFQVTESLPNVTWPLARNWAGNIPVQRVGHPNNTLFFWAFESSNGSFTANSSEPWGIWLNGGWVPEPLRSSQLMFSAVRGVLASLDSCLRWGRAFPGVILAIAALTYEPQNGPIQILGNYSAVENQYAWSTVADYVWIDQPVYVGLHLHDGLFTRWYQWNWFQHG